MTSPRGWCSRVGYIVNPPGRHSETFRDRRTCSGARSERSHWRRDKGERVFFSRIAAVTGSGAAQRTEASLGSLDGESCCSTCVRPEHCLCAPDRVAMYLQLILVQLGSRLAQDSDAFHLRASSLLPNFKNVVLLAKFCAYLNVWIKGKIWTIIESFESGLYIYNVPADFDFEY